jgi:hypothetical protein
MTRSPLRTRLIQTALLVPAVLFLVSCEEIMQVDFSGNSARNLVVEGNLTTDTTAHEVLLSYTGDYFDFPEKEMATGATVSITDGSSTWMLHEAGPGRYLTDSTVYGQPGKDYTLNIRLENGKEYSATDRLRACAPIDSIKQSLNYNSYMGGYGWDVLFYGHEPEPAGDFYLYLLRIDGVLYTDTVTEVSFASDEFVNGNFVRDYPVLRVREDALSGEGAPVTLEMYSVSKAYYTFLSALMIETVWRGSPWDGPPANVPGNISGGATGFFRASAVQRKTRWFWPTPRVN